MNSETWWNRESLALPRSKDFRDLLQICWAFLEDINGTHSMFETQGLDWTCEFSERPSPNNFRSGWNHSGLFFPAEVFDNTLFLCVSMILWSYVLNFFSTHRIIESWRYIGFPEFPHFYFHHISTFSYYYCSRYERCNHYRRRNRGIECCFLSQAIGLQSNRTRQKRF